MRAVSRRTSDATQRRTLLGLMRNTCATPAARSAERRPQRRARTEEDAERDEQNKASQQVLSTTREVSACSRPVSNAGRTRTQCLLSTIQFFFQSAQNCRRNTIVDRTTWSKGNERVGDCCALRSKARAGSPEPSPATAPEFREGPRFLITGARGRPPICNTY